MTSSAQSLATRLLVEAEPEPEPTPEQPQSTPPEAGGFAARDFILKTDLTHAGKPDPGYYQRFVDHLGNRDKRKLDHNTYLLRHPDGNISIRLHATDIITIQPDGIVIVSTYGTPNPKQMHGFQRYGYYRQGFGETARSWRTPFTRARLDPFLPCGWSIYAHGKSNLPSATADVGGKRGDQNWWWSNQHSGSGFWSGTGVRIPFSDFDRIDTKTGELKAKAAPVPAKGRGSNPERTGGYGHGGRFYEHKKPAPNWTETGGIFADLSEYPRISYYAKCPKCGHCHGSYSSMREAHAKRLCQRCDLETIEKIKEVVAHVDDPGMTAKSISRIVGEAEEFNAREFIMAPDSHWVLKAKMELEDDQNVTLDFADEETPLEDPNDVSEFELKSGQVTYTVYVNYDTAKAAAIARVKEDLENEPEIYNQDWLSGYIDTEQLKRDLAPEETFLDDEDVTTQVEELIKRDFLEEDQFYTTTGKFRKITPKLQQRIWDALEEFKEKERENFDPLEHLRDIYGKDEWIKKAFEFAPLSDDQLEKAARDAVAADGFAHFLNTYDGNSIELDCGAVAVRTN